MTFYTVSTLAMLRNEAKMWGDKYRLMFPDMKPQAPLVTAQALVAGTHVDTEQGLVSLIDALPPAERDNLVVTAHLMLRWDDSGYPTFCLTHGLTAQLLQTDCSGLSYRDLKWPFPAFAVQLPQPDPFIVYEGEPGEEVKANYLLFNRYGISSKNVDTVVRMPREISDSPEFLEKWAAVSGIFCAAQGEGPMLHRKILEPDESSGLENWLTQYTSEQESGHNIGRGLRYGELDGQAMRATIRLLTNLSLYLQSLREKGEWHPNRFGSAPKPGKKLKKKPSYRLWNLGHAIKISQEVKAGALRNACGDLRHALDKRYMVRGHWRNQAHGPKMALRRLKWIEPYWKGPSDAERMERIYEIV